MTLFTVIVLVLACILIARATTVDSKRVTLFNNGRSTGGVEHTVARTDLDDLEAWYSQLGELLPVEKNHLKAGEASVYEVYNADGLLVTSFDTIRADDRLYLVADGLLFVWPFVSLGHNTTLSRGQVESPADGVAGDIILESVSDEPRIFKVHNFFSAEEADMLVKNIESITSPAHKLKRSSTGVHTDPDKLVYVETRTSENAFDTDTPTAVAVKRRIFDVLRMPEYDEQLADGLQLLRYRQKQAYIAHHDWFDDGADREFNFDPATGGSNRFATMFMYLSDVDEGGQTVFPLVDRVSADSGIAGLETSPLPAAAEELFTEGDWEMGQVRKCYSKLAFKPKKATALLFYSQSGQGVRDDLSLHGACPVLAGTKWGANLWVWNRVRHGLENSPRKSSSATNTEITAVFVNRAPGTISLRWQDTEMQTVATGQRASFNTYETHEWNAFYEGKLIWTHTIKLKDGNDQLFYIDRAEDLPDEEEVDNGYETEL